MINKGPQWRQVAWFPNYWVSDRGHIFNMKTKRLQRIYVTNKGVKAVRISKNGRLYNRSVEKLRREAFGDSNEYKAKEKQS